MEVSLLIRIIIFPILLLLSAFFSGSETAFFSMNSLERDQLRKRAKGKTKRFVNIFFTVPDELLVTILIGNMLVNIFATTLSEGFGTLLFPDTAELFSIIFMTLILLIIGEMTPKNIAIKHSLRYALFSSYFLNYFHVVFRPLVLFLNFLKNKIVVLYPQGKTITKPSVNSALLSALKMGYQSGKLDKNELDLLESFFSIHQKTAYEVMVPRIHVDAIDASTELSELLRDPHLFEGEKRKEYLIVFDEDVDHISGYVKELDLLPFRYGLKKEKRVSSILRPVHAVPEMKSVTELLREMNEEETEVAVVIGEYGGTSGIITYQTIVEELFEDFFPQAERDIVAVSQNEYRIAGSTEIEELNEFFDTDFVSERRTIAGLLIDKLEDIPEKGKTVRIGDYVFRIDRIAKNRIVEVDMKKVEQ